MERRITRINGIPTRMHRLSPEELTAHTEHAQRRAADAYADVVKLQGELSIRAAFADTEEIFIIPDNLMQLFPDTPPEAA